MNLGRRVAFLVCIVTSIVTLCASAQTDETPLRLEDPTILPQNRIPITAENAPDIDLLAMWGLGNLSEVEWIDNTHLAVAARGGIWVYDLHTPDAPTAILPFLKQGQSDRALPFLSVSPDGEWLGITPNARYSSDSNVGFELWHLPTGKRLDLGAWSAYLPRSADLYVPPFVFVQWLPDNRYLTAYGENVVLWELSPGMASVDLSLNHPRTERTSYHIEHVSVSHNMRWIASVTRADISDQIIVQLWDIESGERRVLYEDNLLPEVPLQTQSVQFNADDTEVALALGYSDTSDRYQQAIWRWNVETGEALSPSSIDCHPVFIDSAHGYVVCDGQDDQTGAYLVQLRNLSDGSILTDPIFSECCYQTKITTTEQYVVLLNPWSEAFRIRPSPSTIIIWGTNGEQVATLDLGLVRINHLAISPDGTRISLLQFNQVQIWDIASSSHRLTLEHTGLQNITNLAASPDGRYLITIGAYPDPVFYAIKYPTRTLRWDLQAGSYEVLAHQDRAFSAAYSPDGRQLVLGRNDGILSIYDAETLTPQNELANGGVVAQVAFSNDGRLLAVANEDYIRIWDTQTWTVINRVEAHSGFLNDRLLFTSDDQWLVYNRQVWKIEEGGRLVARWEPENANDEVRRLLSDGNDDTSHSYRAADGLLLSGLSLIDVNRGTPLWSDAFFSNQRYEPKTVALTEDLIIAGGSDGSLRLYGIVPDGE